MENHGIDWLCPAHPCPVYAPVSAQKSNTSQKPAIPFIVGYAQNELQTGFTLVSAQFASVGSDSALLLSSFVATGEGTSDSVVLQTLDFAGRGVDSYTWIDWAGDLGDQEAWVDGDFNIVENVSFAPGQGLWVQGASGQGIQTAGKVESNDIAVNLRDGFTATGNPFPVSVELQDILALGEGTSDTVVIQTLDYAGRGVDSYTWINWAGDLGDQEAWVDGDFNIVENVSFAPGQGLWVQGNAGQSIQFPAPTL